MKKKESISFQLITPEAVIMDQQAAIIVVPTGTGSMGILPGHAPLIGNVAIGTLRIRTTDKKEIKVFVSDGFIIVSLEGVSILVRSADTENNIDIDRAVAAKERAEKRLSAIDKDVDIQRAQNALLRAQYRIKIAGKTSP